MTSQLLEAIAVAIQLGNTLTTHQCQSILKATTTNSRQRRSNFKSTFVAVGQFMCFMLIQSMKNKNVQESSVLDRELTVAVAAVAVASGTMNFRQASSFQRQYREEIDVIGLNRTVIGFSHGNDTFGWMFRPRVQTHSSRGNLAAFGETLIGRGADAYLREAELEPGMRECTAIVLMPSFVPYCDFDVSQRPGIDWIIRPSRNCPITAPSSSVGVSKVCMTTRRVVLNAKISIAMERRTGCSGELLNWKKNCHCKRFGLKSLTRTHWADSKCSATASRTWPPSLLVGTERPE